MFQGTSAQRKEAVTGARNQNGNTPSCNHEYAIQLSKNNAPQSQAAAKRFSSTVKIVNGVMPFSFRLQSVELNRFHPGAMGFQSPLLLAGRSYRAVCPMAIE
jgi:hypothetical protein